MALARRPRQALRRPRRAIHAICGADGGVLHADAGQDHQGPEGPGGVLMAGKTTRIVMPQLGESVHEGTIAKWLVKPGDKGVEFEPMLEVDTDKVSAEVPSPVSGILREILAQEGQTVQAGAEIAVVEVGADGEAAAPPEAVPSPPRGEGQQGGAPGTGSARLGASRGESPLQQEGREQSRPAAAAKGAPVAEGVPATAPAAHAAAPAPAPPAPAPAAPSPVLDGGEHRFSPAVQMLASELGVDPGKVPGTGIGGGGGQKGREQPAAAGETASWRG